MRVVATEILNVYINFEYDVESGLYHLRARHYSPETGTFLSEDPIGFAGGDPNLYRYVNNNPVNFIDPEGLRFGGFTQTSNPGAFGATVGGAIGVSLGAPFGIPGSLVGGVVGGFIGARIAGYFFPDRTGEGSELVPPRNISPSGTPCLPAATHSFNDPFEGIFSSTPVPPIPFRP